LLDRVQQLLGLMLVSRLQYRVYQDKYSTNPSNTFTQNSAVMRHSGIIIGKNSIGDEGPAECIWWSISKCIDFMYEES
jgi:hypothetical protein